MNKTLSVAAIKNGTVIDHIAAGKAFNIIQLLSLQNSQNKVTIGLHLPSKRLGSKDLIKIENRILTESEINEIGIFSLTATINLIQDFQLVKKIKTYLPSEIKKIFVCSNPTCITQIEVIESHFYLKMVGKRVHFTCHYCEKIVDHAQLKVNL